MDLEQFKSSIAPLRQKLYFTALKLMQDEDDAEDIVQETFLRLWTIRDQLSKVSRIDSYVIKMAKNICIDRLRVNNEEIKTDDFYLISHNETPYLKTEIKDTVDIIRKIIDQLPGLQKQIIIMRDIEGYELHEIATIMDTQTSAVTVNLSRARKRVRDLFQQINEYKR